MAKISANVFLPAQAAPIVVLTLANRLLAVLDASDRDRFHATCVEVDLVRGEVLHEPGSVIDYIYFPTSSFISMMIPVDQHSMLEVGLVGDEGMVGLPLLLGVGFSPLRALVQGSGHAWRMAARSLLAEVTGRPDLHRLMLRYLQVSLSQLAQTAACTRFHVVEQRLARWLLMTQDRAHQDAFHITHEYLAYMLGVRRVGVTKAATMLQKHHLIKYHRGEIMVLDRPGLLRASCSCYQADCDIYDELMGS